MTSESASADTVDGGTLTSGTSVTAIVGAPDRDIQYAFSGTDGVHDTLAVTASAWGGGAADLGVYLPDGEAALFCPLDSNPSFCEFTPHVTGTWTVKVLPRDDATGSVTFTFATDQDRGALTPGTSSTATIALRGQRAAYTFAATKSVHNVIDVSATNWGTGNANLNIYQPDGVNAVSCPLASTPTVCDFTPPVTGTWKAEIAPHANSVGTATMTLAADQNNGPLTPGVAMTTTIASRGQYAYYTFPANKGDKGVITVSATNWGTAGSANLDIFQPDGVVGVICPMTSTATTCTFSPPVTGTWKAGIIPVNNAVGTATMTLVADQSLGTLTPGTAVTTAIAGKGTTASYTFAATKDIHGVFDVSATNWGTGSAELKIYLPNGDLGLSCPIASTSTLCEFIPRVTGLWKVVIDPVADSVGSLTMNLGIDQNNGILTAGTPVTSTFASRGSLSSYTFTGTAHAHLTLDVTATNWGSGSANLFVYQPNGVAAVICALASAPTFCDFTPPVTGTWKVAVIPTGNSLGSATINLAADQNNGTLTPATPATATITTRGQRASYTFAATAGTVNKIKVTAANWGTTGSASLDIYLPNGDVGLRCPITAATATCAFSPHSTGTWKAVVAPLGASLGKATLTLN